MTALIQGESLNLTSSSSTHVAPDVFLRSPKFVAKDPVVSKVLGIFILKTLGKWSNLTSMICFTWVAQPSTSSGWSMLHVGHMKFCRWNDCFKHQQFFGDWFRNQFDFGDVKCNWVSCLKMLVSAAWLLKVCHDIGRYWPWGWVHSCQG